MLELFNSIILDKDSKTPLYVQLYEKLREMISGGLLLADFKLPSVRQFVKSLGVNQVTVVSAFKLLERDSLVYTKSGSGTFVSSISERTPTNIGISSGSSSDELYQQDEFALISGGHITIGENTINFASATPTPDLFPVDAFKLVLNEVLDRDRGSAFGYQDSQGFYPVRESIIRTLGCGISCSPENIQIISGAQQGIDIISKAVLKPGQYVITESPTYIGAIAVFRSRGAQILDVEMNHDGPNLNVFEYIIKKHRPKIVYTIPTFQNPTGYSYSNSKREMLLKLAEEFDFYIIEDDYVSELDFDGKGFVSLKSIDSNDRVIFIKSFSKLFMPGLRLGYMIVPSALQGSVLEAKHTTDISTSGLIQRAFDLYIRRGLWEKHFSYMYNIYNNRYTLVTNALDRYLPGSAEYFKPGGGLNAWVKLPSGFPVSSLVKLASADDIVFAPGKIFYSSTSLQNLNSIRLSFASVYEDQIEHGIKRICDIIDNLNKDCSSRRNMPLL